MSVTTGKVLAKMLDEQRNLTRFYLSKLKGEDMNREFDINGFTTNSPYWIMAHLCWAENRVGLNSPGHSGVDIPWLNDFRIGSAKGEKPASNPSLEEVLAAFKQIHATTVEYISSLSEEELDKEALSYSNELVSGVLAGFTELKSLIEPKLRHWKISRLSKVDLTLLLLGVYELNTDTPKAVVIDEIIKLAKEFSTNESKSFINGILDQYGSN